MNNEQSQIDPILYRGDEQEQRAVTVTAIPDRAMNVEAASLAFLSEDDQTALDTFNQLSSVPRDQQGFWLSEEGERKRSEYDSFIRTGLVDVLADPTVSTEQKQAIVNKAQSDTFAPADAPTMLLQGALVQDSKGETNEGSKVRAESAKWASQAADILEERQGIINAAVGKRDGTLSVVHDLLGMLVPLEGGIVAGKIAAKRDDGMGGTVLPASYIQEIHEAFVALPPDEQNTFLKELAGVVSQSSGLTTSKNQLRVESILNDVTEGSSTGGVLFDNFVHLMDLVGVGVGLKSIKQTVHAARASARSLGAQTSAQIQKNKDEWFKRTGQDIPEETVNVRMPSEGVSTPIRDTVPETLSAYEAQASAMKERLSSVLDRDTLEATRSNLQLLKSNKPTLPARATPQAVTRHMEAKTAREASIKELETTLAKHDEAVDIMDNKLPEVQVKIEDLKGKESLEPIPLNPVAAAVDRAYNQSVMFTHNPRTPGFILGLSNPEKARAVHAQIMLNETENLAQAIHGVSRNEAVVKAVAPQLTDATGRVKRLVDDPEKGLRGIMATELGSAIKNVRDGFRYTEKELASARASVVKDFRYVTGLSINDAMTSFKYEGDSVKVQGLYTNGDGGWASASEAINQTTYALRGRGIREDEITLMKMDGDEFVPVKRSELTEDAGVFAVRVDSEIRVSDKDVTEWDSLDVKRNFLDRFQTSGTGAGWSRYIFEPNSMLNKQLTGPMFVADDKSSVIVTSLLERFQEFTDAYVQLPKALKADVDHYIRDANVHEIAFDPVSLKARFPDSVVDMLKGWRDAWDDVYILENSEVVKQLNKEGYLIFKHPNTDVVLKPVKQKQYANNVMYDPSKDQVVKLTNQEIDDLYAKGGYAGALRRSVSYAGKDVDFVMVRNTPTEHARALRDHDKILEYREGYYQVSYKTPKFIDEHYTDSAGVKRTRTVGVAGNVKDAKSNADRLNQQNNGSTYKYRGDERDIRRSADAYWDLNQSSGRISQRHRGKLLEETVGMKTYGADDFIDNPADSAVRAATSMGGRLAMKDVLDTSKARWLEQYRHLLAGPDFQKGFPASRDQITMKGESYTKELADARTQWEYINYMENGYINGMSDISKMAFNALADAMGEKGYDRVEGMARGVADANVQGGIKGGVFASYLATNPLRQWIVQANQHLRLVGYSGTDMPKLYDLAASLPMFKNSKPKLTKDQESFQKFWFGTGMNQAIHRSNLIRGTLLEATNRQNKVSQAASAVVSTGRAVGYDVGENLNNILSAAAVFTRYRKEGKNISDAKVMAEMHAETRALTRNMAYSGDMPYNQNSLQLVFTYMQVPHKFALQSLDRTVRPADRARLVTADLAIWGVPGTAAVTALFGNDLLPEHESVRELLVDGVQSFLVNDALSKVFKTRIGIDMSSLAPYDFGGWSDIVRGFLLDGGVSSLVANAPAGNVFGLGAENRLGNALRVTASFFKDINSEEITKVNVKDLADAWAKMTSGYNNFQEARIMYQLGKVVDKQGRTTDDDIHPLEAVAKVFGFGTKDTKGYYESLIRAGKALKSYEDTAKEDVKAIYQMVRGLNNGDMESTRAVAMLSQALVDSSSFPSKQAHAKYITALHLELQKTANHKLHEKLAEIAGFPSTEHFGDIVKLSNLPPEEQEIYTRLMNRTVKDYRAIEEANKD